MTPDMPADVPVAAPQTVVTAAAAQSLTQTIVVKSHGYRYEVIGNTLLKPELIKTLLREAADPKVAFDVLNQAYQKAGYFLVALRGNLKNKTFSIQVTEGRLTESKISPDLEGYFSGLEGRESLTRSDVLSKAAMAELYAARQGLRPKLNFEPAQEVGGSRMTVTEEPIENAKFWNANLGFGNYGNRYSSRFLLQSGAALRPGAGLELTANYTHGLPGLNYESLGSNYNAGNVGTSIVTPWGIYGASYSLTNYRISQQGCQVSTNHELCSEGDFEIANVFGNQLLYADEVWRWWLNQGFTYTNYNTQDTLFLLGCCYKIEQARITPSISVFDQNYNFVNVGISFSRMLQLYEQNGSLSGSLNYSRGVGGTVKIPTGIVGQGEPQVVQYSSATPLVPDTLFNLLNWNFVYAQNLPESFRASISLTGQWANSTLPTNQQWVLGGYGNLTAWFPGVVVGDQGMLASASVSRSWEWGPLSLSPSLFLEAGYSQRSFVPQGGQATQFLSDIGIGLTASLKSGTSLTMGSAAPLARSGGEEFGVDKSSNRAYFYFNLTQSF